MSQPNTNVAPIWKIALGLLALYLIWGSVYLAVAIAVDFWPPFLLVGVRFFTAGVCILAFALWRGRPWPANRKQWINAGIVGLLMVTGTNGAITFGISLIDSGMAAVLVATMPLWLILLESLRPGGDRPHWMAWPGLALGLIGIAILMQPNFGEAGNATALIGQFLVIGAAFLWAVGSIFIRHFEMPSSVMMTTALQMIIGSTILLIIGLVKGEIPEVPPHLELWPVVSFFFMLLSAIVGYSTYQWLIVNARPALVSTYAYVNPVIAVLLGVWIASEPFTLTLLGGSLLVLFAAFLIQRVRA